VNIDKLLPGVQKNILLKNYTTFRIGGPAKYFFVAKTKKELIKAIQTAKELKVPFFVLGGGSNVLFSEKGFNGLIIKVKTSSFAFRASEDKQNSKIIEADSGVLLGQVVNLATENNLSGLEWAIGIPGTVGGAIRGNAGAFGKSMKNIVKNVEVLDTKNFRTKKIINKQCKFNYRNSIFKKKPNLIILSAELQFKKSDQKKIENKIRKHSDYRKEHQPLNFPSAGSIFKNPVNLSAGELIEKCGLKGKKIGNVKISEKHANFIVNLEDGKAKDVMKLIKLAKKSVKRKFKINLGEEIQIIF